MPGHLREVAYRREEPFRSAAKKLSALIKEQTRAKPGLDPASFFSRAEKALGALAPLVEDARKSIARAEERLEAGALDGNCAKAERIAGKTVLSLAESLGRLLEKAREGKDIYALRCIRMASNILRRHVEDHLLKEDVYPKSAGDMKAWMIERKTARAKEVYDDVAQALDTVPAEFGIILPKPSLD